MLQGLLAVLCLWGVALVAGFRGAVSSLPRKRLQELAAQGHPRAQTLLRLGDRETRFSVTLSAAEGLLLVVGAYATFSLAQPWGGAPVQGGALVVLAVAALLCRTLPRYTAPRRAERIALRCAPLAAALQTLMHPVAWSVERLALLRGARLEPAPQVLEAPVPQPDEREQAVLRRVLSVAEARVKDVMIPRTQVVGISASATVGEALEVAARHGYSRYPVMEDSLDEVTGIFHVREALLAVARGETRTTDKVSSFVRPAVFVPENKRLVELLRELGRDQMAVVVDEYGGTAGLLTRADLVEEVLEILRTELLAGPEEVEVVDEKNLVVSGQASLEEVNEITGQSWKSNDFHTIGGFVFGLFGRVPQVGERIRYKGVAFEVLELEGRKIAKLKITKL